MDQDEVKEQAKRAAAEKTPKVSRARKTEAPPIPAAPHETQPPDDFPVIGMGASAGGLEALKKFFSAFTAINSLSGSAFIIVLHLSPDQKSMMAELLQRYTAMTVFEILDGIEIQPNCVYVIPPGYTVELMNRRLKLYDRNEKYQYFHPVDDFFRSLARELRDKAICIIFSGTGTEGALGLKAIKGEGGMVMVQDPQTTKFTGMPNIAIETGLVDYILPPEKMPDALLKYVQFYRVAIVPEHEAVTAPRMTELNRLFARLRSRTGHDFSQYKINTVNRRVTRRMSLHQLDSLADYVRFLQDNPLEVDMLFKELLISVTNFFRDPEAFEVLETKILPQVMKQKPPEEPLRIWVIGCATGEEAYSIAIVIAEYFEEHQMVNKVQIFATDIDDNVIDVARAGRYPDAIAMDVAVDRLKQFFLRDGNFYQIRKDIRDMIVFAPQSVIKDPPFSKLDLISCRNLLIYMSGELQRKVIPLLHYTLRPGGALFLGSSESIGEFTDLFSITDKKWKFFLAKPGLSTKIDRKKLAIDPVVVQPFSESGQAIAPPEAPMIHSNRVQQYLLDSFAPVTVLVNIHGDILYIHGRTGAYLELAPGEASLNVIAMAREGLRVKLKKSLKQFQLLQEKLVFPNLRVRTDAGFERVTLSIQPFQAGRTKAPLALIMFEQSAKETTPVREKSEPSEEFDHDYVQNLEDELKNTKEDLQSSVEELETANEELKSTNEELQSTNEELQSSNEELETSKEELQSLNEELVTVNTELQTKIDEYSTANNDIVSLLNSTQIATIFLDNDLAVRRFTPEAKDVVFLIDSDIGRPITHFASSLRNVNLLEDLNKVLRTLIPIEKTIQDQKGTWYWMRILPYRTYNNVIDGIVLTFVDITSRIQMEDELTQSERRLSLAVEISGAAIFEHRMPVDKFTYYSDQLGRLLGQSQADLPRPEKFLDWLEKQVHPDDAAAWRQSYHEFLDGSSKECDVAFRIRHKSGDWRSVRLLARSIDREPDGHAVRVVGVMQDVGVRRALTEHL